MPRRTHYARLQKVEWRSGTCICEQLRVLTCLKAIEAYQRGEEDAEPCPAHPGAPGNRQAVLLQLSVWRDAEGCRCLACDPLGERRRATVQEPVAPPRALPPHAQDGPDVHHDAARAPAGSYGSDGGRGEAVGDGPARNAVVELRRSLEPLPADVCRACKHSASHPSVQTRRPCAICRWSPLDHLAPRDPSITHCLLGADRRFVPCGDYVPLYGGPGTEDGCQSPGCSCARFRTKEPPPRGIPPTTEADRRAARSAEYAELAAQLAAKDALIAENTAKLAQLQAEYEAARRSRREQEHNTPSGAPVYVEQG